MHYIKIIIFVFVYVLKIALFIKSKSVDKVAIFNHYLVNVINKSVYV